MPRRAKRLSPLIFLDEIDVLQMAIAAVEMAINPPRETLGLLLGAVGRYKRRTIYRVKFVQILQRGQRAKEYASYDEKIFARLKKQYQIDTIGDFHSHPNKTDDKYPSHADLDDILKDYRDGVFAILHVHKLDSPEENGGPVILRRKTKIVCYLVDFKIDFYFYTLSEDITANETLKKTPRNRSRETMVRHVYPRCFLRKKIHKPKSTPITVI